MRLSILSAVFALLFASLGYGQPLADHHQHLFSPAIATLISPIRPISPIAPDGLVRLLDEAGIKRAVVLSVAYLFGSPERTVENEYERVKAENDWTSQQVARFPGRLRGFCSFNPLREYALAELARCAKDQQLHYGLKLHFGNSAVDYHNALHVKQVRDVFRAANGYGMAIVVHMRASVSPRIAYGREEALIFLNEILPAAPDIPIQIAHLAGAGRYPDPEADQALSVFLEAIGNADPRIQQLYFDVTPVFQDIPVDQAKLMATGIRQLGVERVLFGSDAGLSPQIAWTAFHQLPLTHEEFQTIANNVPAYLR